MNYNNLNLYKLYQVILNESFVISKENQLWVNGTSLKRYNKIQNKFNFIIGSEPNIYNPIFFTDNINYAIEYAESHVNNDFNNNSIKSSNKFKNIFNENGIIALVKLKIGVDFFDFNDPACWDKIGVDNNLKTLFSDCEVYFAFNTIIPGNLQHLQPIEFKIASYLLKYHYLSLDKNHNLSRHKFKQTVLVDILDKLDEVDYKLDNLTYKKIYQDFFKWYIETIGGGNIDQDGNLQDFIITKSKTGRTQWFKKNIDGKQQSSDNRFKELPLSIDENNLKKINLYFQLFDLYAKNKKYIDPTIKTQLRANINPKKRLGCMDLLQAILHILIEKEYPGYYCPEYKGDELHGQDKGSSKAIAIWNKDVILRQKIYNASQIKQILDYNQNDIKKTIRELRQDFIQQKWDNWKNDRDKILIKKNEQKKLSNPKYIWFKNGNLDDTLIEKMKKIKNVIESIPENKDLATYQNISNLIEKYQNADDNTWNRIMFSLNNYGNYSIYYCKAISKDNDRKQIEMIFFESSEYRAFEKFTYELDDWKKYNISYNTITLKDFFDYISK